MTFYANGRFLGRGQRTANNGKTYYNISILQGIESITLGCNEAVFNELESAEELDDITVRFTENIMNGRNGSFISRYCVGIGET